jgi:hypothetical protein
MSCRNRKIWRFEYSSIWLSLVEVSTQYLLNVLSKFYTVKLKSSLFFVFRNHENQIFDTLSLHSFVFFKNNFFICIYL